MYKPSLTLILSGLFLAYILHSIWSLAQLFIPPKCDPQSSKLCFRSFLTTNPNLHLLLYTSAENKPRQNQVNLIHNLTSFDFQQPFEQYVTLNIPSKTLNNGSLFLHVIVIGHGNKYISKKEYGWKEINAIHEANSIVIPLTQYAKPQLQTFKLLEEQKNQIKSNVNFKPVTHLRTKVTFGIFEDLISLPADQLPIELMKLIIVTPKGEYLPIIKYDFLQTRLCDLSLLTSQNKTVNITISYTPIGIGKLRLLVQLEAALESLLKLGFTEKDIDEVKGVFADINIYLLYVTVFVGSVHLLFDFLSFKNDVAFWRNKKSLVGLSVRTVLWRTFSQAVVFLYLLDEKTSLLVLIPCGIATLIEFWKATKIFNLNVIVSNGLPRISFKLKGTSDEEKKTQMYDAECMQYLSYVLYPLCIAGAVYSLIYEPHKSWYSWTIHSTVNGVYAFGFLFMLPQLFVNYRLKSVAALPWRAFTYKAFNTFIDDLFAFIITMPTAHRVACFRDDVVFLIYLYQRWLYPVDSTRMDDPDVHNEDNMINEKKNIKNEILVEDLKNKTSQQIYDKKKKN